MTFNVYRTTKGKIGEPVYAEIRGDQPPHRPGVRGRRLPDQGVLHQPACSSRPGSWPARAGRLRIEIRCLSPTQYLGMAESDLYLLAESGNFGFNYMKGLFGVWLQAMVLTAIGVFAGTFLSWPVALLTTIAFFVAGQLAFAFLVDFSRQAILGGGPFESLIRILTHDNQMSELTPTAGVVLAKTLDSLVMPVMSMLVYLVPNFQALDVSNMVADGFMVSWRDDRAQYPAGPGLRLAVLLRRLSHLEEPGGRRMNSAPNFNKKLIYGLIIVALFGVMFPYTAWLADEKKNRDLGEAAIGQIDTGSFMMKLFLLGGFRGIVADLLWLRAEEYKKDHDWDRLETTVELITKLQPHFLSIWTFQGWNLAYNVSVEWDAPEDKYTWIKQGIKFVQEGVKKNRRSPDLIWDTAWFYYHKLGFSDESIILRRLFRDDEDESFKTYDDPESDQPVVGNDNFKLGYGWFSQAVKLVD